MLKLRVLATAFLLNGEDVLLMKRNHNRRLFPGFWAALGGHVEPPEINDPRAACLRELSEEAGLTAAELAGLRLCYVINRRAGEEIRVQYVYFGPVNRRELSDCEEGEMHWVNRSEAAELNTSFTTREVLRRHFSHQAVEQGAVQVGVVSADGVKPVINWIPLQDWEQ